jgi:hypothetical protein
MCVCVCERASGSKFSKDREVVCGMCKKREESL